MALVRKPRWRAADVRPGRRMLLAALPLLAAACGEDPTGPTREPSDVELTNEEFTVLRAALVANTDLVGDVARVRAVVDTLGVPLPADLLGATFDWDEALDGYAPTVDGSAPADGLRFVLYDRTEAPIAPFGFLDIVGEANLSQLAVILEKEGVRRLAYVAAVDPPGSQNLVAAGYVTGGSRRVDFTVSQSTNEIPDGVRIDHDFSFFLADESLSLTLDFSLHLNVFSPSTSLVATFLNGDDELIIEFVQTTDNTIDGDVLWNGERIMVVTDDGSGRPLFLGPDGEELSAADTRAIDALLEFGLNGLDDLFPYIIIPTEQAASLAGMAVQSSSTSSNRAIARGSSDWPSQK